MDVPAEQATPTSPPLVHQPCRRRSSRRDGGGQPGRFDQSTSVFGATWHDRFAAGRLTCRLHPTSDLKLHPEQER